ncbi:hypothetical protein PFFVO_05228 [Plasmodium falciparum Vietnam Oak-Knoll (FVO)]|uniref:Uncharacterized protein n=1 Tax=Plasmodium falciparum Vietnam Oak-Knoll (FVO) TaxID=1036723 RepID=A0A024V028_PLAFA|nr:hypothetical protein PFFVO_05228 [Plasmodium falciparum Vietnam Oak-Knoll (FVO)]
MKDVKLSKSNINADENCNELNFKNKIKDNNENCEKEKKEYNDISMNRLNVTCSDFSSSSSMDDDDDDNNNNNNVNINNYNNYHCENRLNLFDNKTKMINGKKKEKKKK